jgi:hypothetical protein
MKKRLIILSIALVLISSLFIITLLKAEENSTPPGSSAPNIPGGEIDPATGLPRIVEQFQGIGENLSESDKRTAYLKAEWQKILEKSSTFGPAMRLINKSDFIFYYVLGMHIAFSWFFFLTLVIYIALVVYIFRITSLFEISTAWIHYSVALIIIVLMTYYKIAKSIADPIIAIIGRFLGVWWMQFIIIGIVILVLILLTYFSKQVDIIWKNIKKRNEKNMQELQQLKMKKDLAVLDELAKVMEK